jgi:hypothetical protein
MKSCWHKRRPKGNGSVKVGTRARDGGRLRGATEGLRGIFALSECCTAWVPLGNQLRDEAQDSLWLVRGTSSAQTVVMWMGLLIDMIKPITFGLQTRLQIFSHTYRIP